MDTSTTTTGTSAHDQNVAIQLGLVNLGLQGLDVGLNLFVIIFQFITTQFFTGIFSAFLHPATS